MKYKIQRLLRGYSDEDLWNLDSHLSELIFPRVRAFLHAKRCGHPFGLSEKEWERILRKIVWTFKMLSRYWELDYSVVASDKFEDKIQDGLNLFAKYFKDLWD